MRSINRIDGQSIQFDKPDSAPSGLKDASKLRAIKELDKTDEFLLITLGRGDYQGISIGAHTRIGFMKIVLIMAGLMKQTMEEDS